MMRNLFKLFMLSAVAAASMVSCQESDEEYYDNSGRVVYASTPTPNQTKMVFTDNDSKGIALDWEGENDLFTLYDQTGIKDDYKCTDVTNGEFTSINGFAFETGESYTAIYPKVSDISSVEEALNHDYTSVQNGDAINNLSAACLMRADFTYEEGKDVAINFNHLNAIMTFTFESDEKPSKLEFKNGDDLYTVNYSAIEPVNGLYTSHIMIKPCGEGERKLSFALFNASGEAYDVRATTTSKAYEAGYRYTASVSDYAEYSWNGKGTLEEPYEISSAYDLRLLSQKVSEKNYYSGSYFKLTKSIDLEGSEDNQWIPIGTYLNNETKAFKGTFDGAGHTVSGLYINTTESSQALFGEINGATIKDLTVSGSVTANEDVAGVVGYADNSSKVENCTNEVEVCGVTYNGGVVGRAQNSFLIIGCINKGKVTGTDEQSYTGGIISRISKKCTIENCQNSGSVNGTLYIGGIVGHSNDAENMITSCSNSGNVTSATTDFTDSYCGGIVGESLGKVEGCSNSGTIKGDKNRVGGVVGYARAAISKCWNNGSVIGTGSYIGGIAGYTSTYGTVDQCYNDVNGTVEGDQNVGGIVGYSYSVVSNCYNRATINATNTFNGRVGGIIGYSSYNVNNCYSASIVTSGTSGGIGAVIGHTSDFRKIVNCYYNSTIFTGDAEYGLTASTTDQMKDPSYYSNLNADQDPAPWSYDSSKNDGYPIFTWQ